METKTIIRRTLIVLGILGAMVIVVLVSMLIVYFILNGGTDSYSRGG